MRTNTEFKLLPVVAAILLAYGPAHAEDSEVQGLIAPDSSISVGVGVINNARDAKRFSQYTGLNQNTSALLDIEVNKRDDATGFWTKFNARNLGLDTRELNFSQSRQGDWKYALDYNEIVRRDPYIINTGMTGIGSTNPTINLLATPVMPGAWGAVKANLAGANTAASPNSFAASNGVAGRDVELKLKRTAVGISGEKWITPELQFEMSFRNEDKQGARMFGRVAINSSDLQFIPTIGTSANLNGNWAVLLTPEPVNSTTKMFEGKLNFARDNLAVTAGYFGSFYNNHNNSLAPTLNGTALNRGPLWNGVVGGESVLSQVSSGVALPPDNQAHQFYLSGNYAFSDTTRSNFKLAYTKATQNQAFVGLGLTPTNPALTSLNGEVDTTLAQFGLSMKPVKDLSVNASLRYEDRSDKTPIRIYNYGTTVVARGAPYAALNGTSNWNAGSQTRTTAKLDGVYRLPSGYSVMLGGDWERKATPLPPANSAVVQNQMFFRTVLNEYGIHTEVRKAMSATLNGALGIEYKQRRGNDWWTTNGLLGNALTTTVAGALVSSTNNVLPDMYMDRNRTKLRGNIDWEVTEKLSLQAAVEHTRDDYLRQALAAIVPAQVIPTVPGARTITSDSLSLDGTYIVSEDWRVNAFGTRSYNRWNVNKANLGDDTRNTTDTLGVGVSGKATSRLTIGMDLLVTQDKTTFNNVSATAVAGAAAGNILGWNGQALPGNYLPAINYKTNKLNLHAKYDVDKVSSVQALFSYQQFRTDDWQWGYNGTPFLYSDNTTVSQPMSQNLKYASVSYMLKF